MAAPQTSWTARLRRAGVCVTLLAVGIAGWVAPCPAQAGEPRHIALAEAIEIALRQNSTLRRAENQSALDHVAVSQAAMSFVPNLGLSLSGSRSYTRSSAGDSVRTSTSSGSVRAGLSTGLVLFDGLANVADLRQARLEEDAGRLELERARQTVVFQVMTGYLAVIEAQEQVRVREENLSAQEGQERLVRALVEGGTRPVSDLYQQQASVASARQTLVEARRTYELGCIDLVQQLQLDPIGQYVFDVPPLPEAQVDAPAPELAPLLERALGRRADFIAGSVRKEAAGYGESSAKAGRWPTVSLSASYGAGYADTAPGDLLDQFGDRQSGSVGISLSLPLFDRLATRSAIERARVSRANAQLALADLRQEVALEVRRAILDVISAREQLRAADARAIAAQQALDVTQQRYEAGAATLYEVTLSRADWVGASSDRVSARYNLLWQERLLEYHVGDLDPAGRLS